jgi:hypothetical protein
VQDDRLVLAQHVAIGSHGHNGISDLPCRVRSICLSVGVAWLRDSRAAHVLCDSTSAGLTCGTGDQHPHRLPAAPSESHCDVFL